MKAVSNGSILCESFNIHSQKDKTIVMMTRWEVARGLEKDDYKGEHKAVVEGDGAILDTQIYTSNKIPRQNGELSMLI